MIGETHCTNERDKHTSCQLQVIANSNRNMIKLLLLSILLLSTLCQYYGGSSYTIPIAAAFTIDDFLRPSSIRPTYQQLSTKSTISIQQQQYTARLCRFSSSSTSLQMSSIGGGNMDNSNNDNNDDEDDNPINEWIGRKESDNVRRYREMNSEGRLPISYGAMNTNDDDSDDDSNNVDKSINEDKNDKFGPLLSNTQQTDAAIDATSSSSSLSKPINPYLNVVSRLTPSDLISRFTSSASPRVQDAV